jgi:isocitrate/isopropylmalate dehydrogenase
MPSAPRIVLLPGDGIGPEIVRAARRLLEALGEFEFEELLMGGLLDRRTRSCPYR